MHSNNPLDDFPLVLFRLRNSVNNICEGELYILKLGWLLLLYHRKPPSIGFLACVSVSLAVDTGVESRTWRISVAQAGGTAPLKSGAARGPPSSPSNQCWVHDRPASCSRVLTLLPFVKFIVSLFRTLYPS